MLVPTSESCGEYCIIPTVASTQCGSCIRENHSYPGCCQEMRDSHNHYGKAVSCPSGGGRGNEAPESLIVRESVSR